MNTFNILIGAGIEPNDKVLFFADNKGELESPETFVEGLQGDIKFPQLLARLGVFESATQARKNGWDKEIPNGFSEYKIGKKVRNFITILKIP